MLPRSSGFTLLELQKSLSQGISNNYYPEEKLDISRSPPRWGQSECMPGAISSANEASGTRLNYVGVGRDDSNVCDHSMQ
jgi:hypothetical protein